MTNAPTCHKCGSELKGNYCSDLTCPYSSWPQFVNLEEMYENTTEFMEQKYNIKKREARNLEISTMLTVGSCCITEKDSNLLECDEQPDLFLYPYTYGWFISIHEYCKDNLLKMGYSEDFCKLLDLAKSEGCKILQIDQDADPVEGLATFEW